MISKFKNLLFDSHKGKIQLNERASIFFFCLALSTFFWFLSSLSKVYSTDVNIPLEYKSYNKDFILTSPPPTSIIVNVRGSGFELLGEQLSINQNSVTVDLANALRLGKNRYGIATQSLKTQIQNSLDKDLVFERITSDSLIFETDKRISKKLKVVPNLNLSYESSFNQNGEIITFPEYVIVSGPKSRMDSLKELRTPLLVEEEIEDTLNLNVKFINYDIYSDLTFEPKEVKIQIPVDKFTEKVFELPIEINSNRGEILTFPNKVKVIFLVPLNNYEILQQSDLTAQVKFNLGSEQLKKLPVTVKGVPNFAKLLRVEPEKVEFIIKK